MNTDFDFFDADSFPVPWADDPFGYWQFEADAHCMARLASGTKWKRPFDTLHVDAIGERNVTWGGMVSHWPAPAYVTVESLVLKNTQRPGTPPGHYVTRGVAAVTAVEVAGKKARDTPTERPWVVAVVVHGDGDDLCQAVSVVTRKAGEGRAPLILDGDVAIEMWAEVGKTGIGPFISALGIG